MGYLKMASRRSRKNAVPKDGQPSFPAQQLFILAMCRICEPIAFMSIFPYIYFMIEDFNITDDKSKISVYAGMVTSAFTLAECSTGLLWGRLSDRIGRKPVLLTGLTGTALSVLIFGFAPSLQVALFARALGGLLNGNIGVLQTTVAELVKVKEHQSRAYSVMPLTWCIGSVVGPMIGGALARPCISYPSLFPPGTIWERYPYLLPNLFSAATVCFGVVVGLLFLEETHMDKRSEPDRGLELGRRLTSWVGNCVAAARGADKRAPMSDDEEEEDDDEQLPRYRTTENSPLLASTLADDPQEPLDLDHTVAEKPAPKPFTRQVVMIIVSYGILAFHTMTFDQLFPVFLSTVPPEKREPFNLPFKFVDGFGLDTKTIGFILAVQGIYSMASTMLIFPVVNDRLGPLNLFRLIAVSYFLLYLTTPYLVLLPESARMAGIYIMIIWKCTFSTLAYPSNAILLTNSAPSSNLLGTINGVAASTASLCRAFGPTISGFLYAMGLQTGYSGLAWWVSALVTIVGAAISFQLVEPRGRMDLPIVPKGDVEDAACAVVAPLERTRPGYGATESQRA